MIRANRASLVAIAAVAALGVAGVIAALYPRNAEAQSGTIRTLPASAVITYSSAFINQVVPAQRGDAVREVLPFPDSSVFLVRTGSAVTVWERQQTGLLMLLNIQLDDNFEKVVFLEDKRTFVLQYRASAKVYSVDRKIVTPGIKPNN
ncbi:hypothetical protein BH09SUM1_BH09SUM1_12120 [soil metagenome]